GMISKDTIKGLEERGLEYILGARMRRQREVREAVLSRAGRYQEVAENLRVKEVRVGEHRYIVCHNPAEEAKDAADRAAILASLDDQLREGAKQLVGNRGYRRYLRVEKQAVSIDLQKAADEARYDGKFVLRTNTALPASEVAIQYKRLLLVEQFFRTTKSLVETRPIFHHWDATIRGHVFCSFLALVLMDELQRRLAARGWKLEWENIRQDLEVLDEVEVRVGDQRYLLRTDLRGVTGKVLQGVGVAIPPPARLIQDVVPKK
ncbi:MAG: transposase, partial [Chloroflexota bacterium]|nr:transposase [Chloroflexota bacterium]